MSKRGKFIVVLGGEGSGKSHMISRITKALQSGDLENISTTREPGGSEFGEIIRGTMFHKDHGSSSTPQTQFGLAWAARHDHVAKKVRPELDRGVHIVCDRFDCCTYAYQVMADRSLEPLFWDVRELYLGDCAPDCYIFLDVDVRTGLARAKSRNAQGVEGNFFDDAAVEFHEQIRQGYNEFLRVVPMPREKIIVIDANQPLDVVEAEFMATLKKALAA